MIYIALILLFVYIVASMRNGVPISLSDTYYLWNKWVFPSVMWFTGFVLLPYWLEYTTNTNWEFLPFISCLGVVFVGALPNIRTDRVEYKIHMFCAYLASLAAIISMVFICGEWYVFPIITIVNFICFFKEIKNKYTFLLELSIFASVFYTLLC